MDQENVFYEKFQQFGQIIYKPTQQFDVETPEENSEVFVGKIPTEIDVVDVYNLFQWIGQVHQVRLMINLMGESRGFSFVEYYRQWDANQAVKILNGFCIRPGKKISVLKSVNNCRLFFGGIPQDKTLEEVKAELRKYAQGIKEVIMYPSLESNALNRGFVFVEFDNHRLAAIARKIFSPGSLSLWGTSVKVDWAEPLPDPDPFVMMQVKVLFLRNLTTEINSEDLRAILRRYISLRNVTRVYKRNNFAFIHFIDRATAETAKTLITVHVTKFILAHGNTFGVYIFAVGIVPSVQIFGYGLTRIYGFMDRKLMCSGLSRPYTAKKHKFPSITIVYLFRLE